ncbi:MAG: HAD-IIB family hydrolase [Pirellulales bacterium]|nr:HAD-IIB family hydrolase [Pirellulales bacterium]
MYIQMISVHGLIRGENIEMGRDADTGGQVRYVLELANMLSTFDEVEAVDLFTRRINDKRVSSDYSKQIEQLNPKCRLVRLSCGGGRYIRKERLWPYLDDYVDAMISFTRREHRIPTVVHGHYADAGYIGKEVASVFDVPFVFTGHSLGKTKLDYLLEEGWTRDAADREYNISHRIGQEQACLAVADLVVTSTRHERDMQYRDYYKDEKLKFEVIPPGTDLERFFPYYEYDMPHAEIDELFKQARVRMANELGRFHLQPDKPLILSLCRPDRRKNIGALIKAYGKNKQMQALANLAIFAGIRKDIATMEEDEQQVLTDMLLMMDRYDLYGKLAIPKWHDSEREVPELYRLAAEKRGVFVNPAFTELFGLTAIEASATGLPFVATQNGGPQDIVANCESGILVDVNDGEQLSNSIIKFLTDKEFWDRNSNNGINRVRKHYSWKTHCRKYLECLKEVVKQPTKTPSATGRSAPGRRLASVESMLITDIDNTLLGDEEALAKLREFLHEHREQIGFGIASGRSIDLVTEVLEQNGINETDVIIAAVGSEIYYGKEHAFDKGWASHLRTKWRPDRVRETLAKLPFLHLQEDPQAQREFKISYDLEEGASSEEALPLIHNALAKARAAYKLVFSHGTFIDILPHRASKGKAVRYLSGKWNIPLEKIATAGDSGNDSDMLVGQTAGIVVANHTEELEYLRKSKTHRVYFTEAAHAGGIIEGLQYYGLQNENNREKESERDDFEGALLS